MIHTISTRGTSWTATENCYMIGMVKQKDEGLAAVVSVNGVDVCSVYAQNSSESNNIVFVPVKKEQIVTTRATYGQYDIKFYGLC